MPSNICPATSSLTASLPQPHVALDRTTRGTLLARVVRMQAHLAGNDEGPSQQQLRVGGGRGQQGPAACSKASTLRAVEGGLVRAGQRSHNLARTHRCTRGDRGLHADARLSLDADRLQHHGPGRHPEGSHLRPESAVVSVHIE